MPQKLPWTPWHRVVKLREDVRTGELSLADFAADLHDVMMQRGARPIYEDPVRFFALTYPTFSLRELARDVVLRLAGRNTKAVRQLELTYGGGKTHTLVALRHLAHDPASLPNLPAVEQFKSDVGAALPPARVAALAFDKLDVEKGMEVRGPQGELRWLRHPWSVLAFQIAGATGIRALHAEGKDEERETAPAEPLLVDLLSRPQTEGLATLVLIDEVLMFARGKVAVDEAWRGRLTDFFQYLCQAVTKVDRCALVASLLASDLDKSDDTGKAISARIGEIFNRQKEEGVQPVQKEDVAEVLRRRFFTPASIADSDAFLPHVTTAVRNLAAVDDVVRKDRRNAEERFARAYPFHPDLTDLFYTRWTQLDGFQRTRGILRTFAIALRDAEPWDTSPLVGPNVFLPAPDRPGIAEAARELTGIATREVTESRGHDWAAILEGELAKARGIQDEQPGLKGREMEQAICTVFLSSQPTGQKTHTRDLIGLVGATRPDRIELEQGLRRWTELSWFLDENEFGSDPATDGGPPPLPKAWRLGNRPNLKQMHHDACTNRVMAEAVEVKLLAEVRATKSLTYGTRAFGARVHMLPERPRDVEDDGEFHFAVLPPAAVSNAGRPSRTARRFIDETTGPDRPRIRRNAVVLVAPSTDGLDVVRTRIREYLGWDDVQNQLKGQPQDPVREDMLATWTEESRRRVPEAIRQAWTIVVTVNPQNEAQAFRVTVGSDPLFATVKADRRARIQETAINAEALLPGGPYDLARRRAVTPGQGSRERVRRESPAAEDAASPGDRRHHRPRGAGRPVRGVAPAARPDGQDLVADAGRRDRPLGTGPRALPAPRRDPVRPRSGHPGPRNPAGALERRLDYGRCRDRLLLGRADGDGPARRLRRAGRHPGLSRECCRGGRRGGGPAGRPLAAQRTGQFPGRADTGGRSDPRGHAPRAAGPVAGAAPHAGRRAGRLEDRRSDRPGTLGSPCGPGTPSHPLGGAAPGGRRCCRIALAGDCARERALAVRRGRRGSGDVEAACRFRTHLRCTDGLRATGGVHVVRGAGSCRPAGPGGRAAGDCEGRCRRAAGVPAGRDTWGQRQGCRFGHPGGDRQAGRRSQPGPATATLTCRSRPDNTAAARQERRPLGNTS